MAYSYYFIEVEARLVLVQVVYRSIGLHGATIRFVAQGEHSGKLQVVVVVSFSVIGGIDEQFKCFFKLP